MKAYESARLSLAEFRRRSGSDSGRKRRRDEGHVIATVFWYFRLRCRVGVLARVGLEALIEPNDHGAHERGRRESVSVKAASGLDIGPVGPSRVPVLPAGEPGSWSQQVPDMPLGWDAVLTARLLKRRQLELTCGSASRESDSVSWSAII